MSGIRLHGKVPPWGLSGWGWWNGEEQWHQGQRCNTRLPNSPYQCCSLLAGNEKVPEKMIHAARKETVSYAGKDLSNTLMPSSVSPHQAPGKQSLTTRVWIVSMPSVLGTLLLPHAPPISSHDKWIMGAPLSIRDHTTDGPSRHTRAHGLAVLLLTLSTMRLPAPLYFISVACVSPSFHSPSRAMRPTLCSSPGLISGAVMDTSVISFFCTCSPPHPKPTSPAGGSSRSGIIYSFPLVSHMSSLVPSPNVLSILIFMI